MAARTRLPLARTEGLVVEELGDEILIYDLDVKHAHCLSPAAAQVWRVCDGRTETTEIERRLDLTSEVLDAALDELDASNLLVSPSVPGDGLSRRELGVKVTKVAVGAATVPLILSIAAPAAAQTDSQIAICRSLGTIEKNECGGCNAGGSPTVCCCCHYAPGKKFCAAGDADCFATAPGIPGFQQKFLNCTEDPDDV
ncbi:MAG: hypothetical protein H0W96_07030 [Solirubrobacterales bacterium]|nr:hypothetical protein [Solirubrobacterales bacterium]